MKYMTLFIFSLIIPLLVIDNKVGFDFLFIYSVEKRRIHRRLKNFVNYYDIILKRESSLPNK